MSNERFARGIHVSMGTIMGIHGSAVGYCSEGVPDMSVYYRTYWVARLRCFNLLLRDICMVGRYEKHRKHSDVIGETPEEFRTIIMETYDVGETSEVFREFYKRA